MSEREGFVEFDNVTCIGATSQAILVVIDKEKYWIPNSQVHDDSEVYQKGDKGTLIISEWIASERGLN